MRITNKKLSDLLDQAVPMVKEVADITNEIDALEKKRNITAIKYQKLKDKINVIVLPYEKKFDEFEEIVAVDAVLDANKTPTGEIEIKTVNRLEEFQRFYNEEKAKTRQAIKG